MKPFCVYHHGCTDGTGALLAATLALDVEACPGVHNEKPDFEKFVGRDVLFVDFSYKRPVLEEIVKVCRSLLILDHHVTARDDLAFLDAALPTWEEHVANPGVRALFDMNRSGAMITFDYLLRTSDRGIPLGLLHNMVEFMERIQDRDLWKNTIQDNNEFIIALRSYPHTVEAWIPLVKRGVQALVSEGYPIQRYYRQRVEEFKANAMFQELDGHRVPVVNCPFFAASEVAGELAEGHPFAAGFYHTGTKWTFSLRSRGDFNVSELAKKFGGGGHAQAAGFAVEKLPWST